MRTFICLLLLSAVFATRIRSVNKQLQAKSSMLGFSGVFAQVRSMLATEGPYSDVYALIDNMKTNLIAEQANQRAVYESQMTDCDAEKELRSGEMDEATTANKAA